jgi:hypothetical protein
MRAPKRQILLFFSCILVTLWGCKSGPQPQPEVPPFRSIRNFASDLAVAERRAGQWKFTEEILKRHALAIAKFMDGEPPARYRKVHVRIGTGPDYPSEDENTHVLVFFDDGIAGYGYDFLFLRQSGIFNGVIIVRGQ